MNGIININKPKGFTSHDVVAKLRGILSTKKIGHTGTLDPDAVGVLPICVGKATKTADMLTATDKQYIAKVALGTETDTQDASGTVVKSAKVDVTEEDIQRTVRNFIGEIEQIPPMYSAIKVDGKKLYELAREGKEIEREPRKILIKESQIQEINLEGKYFTMKVDCSKGTYIRTLCTDIGRDLGCYAHMAELCRTKSGRFFLETAVTLEEVEEMVKNEDFSFFQEIDKVFEEFDPLYISERKAQKVRNGIQISTPGLVEGKTYRVYDEQGEFLTISKAKDNRLIILKTFFTK